jgi:hypothetical protein
MPNLFCEYTDTGDADDLMDAYHHVRISYPTSSPMPEFIETWEVVSYEESEETVVLEMVMTREEF